MQSFGATAAADLDEAGIDVAVEHLRARGYTIRARNADCGDLGTFSIVAADGRNLVFFDVFAQRGDLDPGTTLAVPHHDAGYRRFMAIVWATRQPRGTGPHPVFRFDAISVVLRATGEIAQLTHTENV